jgi:8-oxo-dGTP pyrophosphatase MutT (NUDIX family)
MEGLKKVAVICILKHQDIFLLLERLKEPNKDSFMPLGGKIDPFETPLDTAKRETWEESGIVVEDRFLWNFDRNFSHQIQLDELCLHGRN